MPVVMWTPALGRFWRRNMKKIGLVGGTGPESTLMYYKELNCRIDKLTNNKQMPDIAIESVNFRRAWDYVSNQKYDSLVDYLSEKIENLKATGAEVIALTAATMHIVYEQIVQKTNVNLVSIPKSVCEEIKKKGYKKVGLLGTIFTMEQDYMKKEQGIEVMILGCTELPLLLNKNNCPVDCLDCIEIHLQKLIELAEI